MTCFHPLTAYRSLVETTESGKAQIYFNISEAKKKPYEVISLPCSRCIGCRIDRSKQWAVRCVHEASLHEWNCFITLTFNNEHLISSSLDKRDFQLFMKRLRKKFKGDKIRYFHCGEYGDKMERPHHHACLFGIDFYDKELISNKNGTKLYHSQILEDIWGKGFCCTGDVTFQSAAYVARYIIKKLNGKLAAQRYIRDINKETGECTYLQPEYITMSRRPGIGKGWYKKYGKTDIFPKDYLTIQGRKFRIPKYYQNMYEIEDEKTIELVKKKRKERAERHKKDSTWCRLMTRKKIMETKVKRLKRSYENDTEPVQRI